MPPEERLDVHNPWIPEPLDMAAGVIGVPLLLCFARRPGL
jgi:hypothetical protein